MSIRDDLALVGRYVVAFALIGYGAWGLTLETRAKMAPRVTDPHAIVLGLGLTVLPFLPGWFAAGAAKVLEVWRGYKAVK